MDFKAALEQGHSKEIAIQIAHSLIAEPEQLEAYLTFLSKEPIIAQRASWPLATITDEAQELLEPFQKELLDAAERNLHPAVSRNILRYFQFAPIRDESVQEKLLDVAFRQMESPTIPVAIRVFAMQAIEQNTKTVPELRQALADSIALRIEEEKPGFKSRGKKILKALEKEHIFPSV